MAKAEGENQELVDKYKALDKLIESKCSGLYTGFSFDKRRVIETEYVPIECISLSGLLGGYPKGKIIEFRGGWSGGKTTLAFYLISQLQKAGYRHLWIDTENSFDDKYAKACGINIDPGQGFAVIRPETAEDSLEALRITAASGIIDFMWLDSVASMACREEKEKSVDDKSVALKARLMSRILPQLASSCSKNNCSITFINQLRTANIGGYGPSTTGTGGMALPYNASLILDINKRGTFEESGIKVGQMSNVKAVKSKLDKVIPWSETSIPIAYMREDSDMAGVDVISDTLDYAMNLGIVNKSGSWISYGDSIKAQGKEKFKLALFENPKLLSEILSLTRDELNK
jgi:recombination protein RecA